MNPKNNSQLYFEPINNENRTEAENLLVLSEQPGFIESVGECLQGADNLNLWRPVYIYDGDIPIGFMIYDYFPPPLLGQLWLDRLLIDKRYQGEGYGKQAVFTLLDRLRVKYPGSTVYLSMCENNTKATRLYEQIGFYFNGKCDTRDEHMVAYLWEKGREGK